MKEKIYELLQSSNTELAWQLDEGQGYGVKQHLEKVFKPFLKNYTIDELFTEDQLWLYNLGLDSIPSEIGLLSQLRGVDLSGNNLTEIPKEIGDLSQLEWLYLDNNNLITIPKEIRDLSQLEGLYLSGNSLPQEEVDKVKKMLPNCKIFKQKKV